MAIKIDWLRKNFVYILLVCVLIYIFAYNFDNGADPKRVNEVAKELKSEDSIAIFNDKTLIQIDNELDSTNIDSLDTNISDEFNRLFPRTKLRQ